MKIIIDSREQRPYRFAFSEEDVILVSTLKTGDYSLDGYEDKITIERKSLSDFFLSCGRNRKRFEAEIKRMADMAYAAVIVEADWETIIHRPPTRSKLNPKAIYATVIAWQIRYGVHFWMCPNRAFAEKTTYRILERYEKDSEKDATQ